ncbi:hypothetical protein ACFLRX_09390 [Acidobacteriota bacterium]
MGVCEAHAPCYSGFGNPGFCAYLAPDAPGGPGVSWWGTPWNAQCIVDKVPDPNLACCFLNAGMYGFLNPGDEFYYWHEPEAIVVY